MNPEDDQLLPSPMQMVARGNKDPLIRRMASEQQKDMRRQALDDQVFAALLERLGGDEETAALYWRLSRKVQAYIGGRHGAQSVADVFDTLDLDDDPDKPPVSDPE